jgi:hypothetical protein
MSFAKEPIGRGDVVAIKEAHFEDIRGMYPDLRKEDTFEVAHVDKTRGSKTMYLKKSGRDGLLMLWLRQVRIVKRCGNPPSRSLP